jgi:cytochrome c oxidase cbb3-type subunit 2/cytochrome c oxidase cbb3-type subunit I/II
LAASAAAKFAIAGLGFLLFTVAMAFVASLRSVAAVLGLTFWESGVETAALLGGFTLFAIAACVGASEVLRGGSWGRWWARATLLPVVGGAGIAAGAQLTAGVQQGVRWLSAVQTGEYANSGPGFGAGLDALRGPSMVHAAGLALVAVGALFFALRLLTMSFGRGTDDAVTAAGFPTQPIDALLRRAVAVFALAGVGAFALPAIDSAPEASVLAESSRHLSGPAALGREIYIAEGCWYCHTQQVRQVLTDVGLGPVSVPGDYVYDPVGLAGMRRIGPDLAHVASRPEGSDAAVVRARLLTPGGDSTMPSYAHLTDAELEALAAYVTALE